jgi:hypothetical protein
MSGEMPSKTEDTVKSQSHVLVQKDYKIKDLETQLKNTKYQLQLNKQKSVRSKSAADWQEGSHGNKDNLEESCDCRGHFLWEVYKLMQVETENSP